jgi:hypothetical protein
MSTVKQLTLWAENHPGERGDLAKKLATALQDRSSRAQWSLVDVRREFECRRESDPKKLRWYTAFSTISYLFPIAFAWYELRMVFGAFGKLPVSEKESVNFLAFWAGRYTTESWQYGGRPVASVALIVCLLFAVIAALHFKVVQLEGKADAIDTELNNLILDATLEIAKDRAITPEEMADALNAAAKELEKGLLNLSAAIQGTEQILNKVGTLTQSMESSSDRIKDATLSLAGTLQPLAKFGEEAGRAGLVIDSATQALSTAKNGFMGGMSESIKTLETVNSVTSEVTNLMKAAQAGLSEIAVTNRDVARSSEQTLVNFEKIAESLSRSGEHFKKTVLVITDANQELIDLAQNADSPQVHTFVAAIEKVSSEIFDSATMLNRTVEHVSSQLETWSGKYGDS